MRPTRVLPTAFLLLMPLSSHALEPGFDCARADSDAEDAICASDALAALDLELARLYRAALDGPNMTEDRADLLRAEERGWIKGRNECWKASVGLETCIANSYAARIHEIREGYADARADAGASDGPFPVVCEGLDGVISAVFVNTDQPLVSLKWRESQVILPLVPSGSGAKYESDIWTGIAGEAAGAGGMTRFWTQGEDAVLSLTGGPDMACMFDEAG